MHVFSHMSANWLLCSSSYSSVVTVVLYLSRLKFVMVIDVHEFFSYTPSCMKIFCVEKIIGLFLDMKVTQVTVYTFKKKPICIYIPYFF